ncbi:MAG: biopolymer transporter ExbD [Planctomycetaceae bacterium]|nr:biopolymer transporter ExbD [Planctomycetaceae bacterium]
MKIPVREREHGLRFNITPLIDIVFLLIIFFLAASHLARSEALDPVELAEATQIDEETERSPRRITVTVSPEGMSIGGEPTTFDNIEQLIIAGHHQSEGKGSEVRIRADYRVPYADVEPIMLSCARAGVASIGFQVLRK